MLDIFDSLAISRLFMIHFLLSNRISRPLLVLSIQIAHKFGNAIDDWIFDIGPIFTNNIGHYSFVLFVGPSFVVRGRTEAKGSRTFSRPVAFPARG
jgi:hypothetical protein